jgi:hypothetical protein
MSEKKERPPVGDSWIDYATRHQHAGARPCWQCNARELALAEYEAAQERVRELERELSAWKTDADTDKHIHREEMLVWEAKWDCGAACGCCVRCARRESADNIEAIKREARGQPDQRVSIEWLEFNYPGGGAG